MAQGTEERRLWNKTYYDSHREEILERLRIKRRLEKMRVKQRAKLLEKARLERLKRGGKKRPKK